MTSYLLLKCDFHSHYHPYGDKPETMVKAFFSEGYDCMAQTEHSHRIRSLDDEHKMKDWVRENYGSDFIYIVGEEIDFGPGKCRGHLLSLFIEEYITPETKEGELISLKDAVDRVHEQRGLAFLAHDRDWKARGLEPHWNARKGASLDGWEVCTISQNGSLLSHPHEAMREGYIILSNTDAHRVEDVVRWGKFCHTHVFARERSVEAVKEALVERRTVAYCKGLLFGKKEWVIRVRSDLPRI